MKTILVDSSIFYVLLKLWLMCCKTAFRESGDKRGLCLPGTEPDSFSVILCICLQHQNIKVRLFLISKTSQLCFTIMSSSSSESELSFDSDDSDKLYSRQSVNRQRSTMHEERYLKPQQWQWGRSLRGRVHLLTLNGQPDMKRRWKPMKSWKDSLQAT